jgi:hypothetical protein
MSPHTYTEDKLVEQPAIGLFAALGWQTLSAMEETFGAGGTLGRETKGEVVLIDRLRAALTRLNPGLPAEAIQTAIDELARDRAAMSLEAANREIYRLLKDGIAVSVPDREHGGQKTERLRVVDWASPEQNDFLLVSQLSVVGSRSRPVKWCMKGRSYTTWCDTILSLSLTLTDRTEHTQNPTASPQSHAQEARSKERTPPAEYKPDPEASAYKPDPPQ